MRKKANYKLIVNMNLYGVDPSSFIIDDSIINPYDTLLDNNKESNVLFQIPTGVKNIPEITGDKLNREKSPIDLLALLNPPDNAFSSSLNKNEQTVLNNLTQSTDLQLIKQFYETYFSPTGLSDATYRLGEVSSIVNNLHEMIPEGAQAILSDGDIPDWRTNVNYTFKVNTGLKDSKGNFTKPSLYVNYAFGPMTPRRPSELTSSLIGDLDYNNELNLSNENLKSFDIENLYYKGNMATLRRPGFKSINDNINLIQFLYEKAFGVESTYINEWDLSIYMQEGLVDAKQVEDINHPGQFVMAPVFVTNLTFGLINDSPIRENIDNDYYKQLTEESLDRACTFGSLNLAVSSRKAIDSVTFSKSANNFIYNISSYPLSKYWTPSTAGENLNYTYEVTENDEVIYSDMNVSRYWAELFALRESGKIYAAALDDKPKYTVARIFGDNLRSSSRSFEYLLKYEDNKQACLSGWNSTDINGEIIGKETSSGTNNPVRNYYKAGNPYSWLPYWKQFFFNEGEGLEELDQYWQSLYGDGQEYHSFLTTADDILNIIASDNKPFNSFRTQRVIEYNGSGYSDSDPTLMDDFELGGGTNSGYGNITIRLPIIGKITIPNTKLLNMFIHRSDAEKKATNMSKNKNTSDFLNTGSIKVEDKDKNEKLETKSFRVSMEDPNVIIDPTTGEITSVSIDEDIQSELEPIGKNLSYADGVNNFSPFLYGGPHGTSPSPNTIEGYIADGAFLKNVPTLPLRTRMSTDMDNKGLLRGSFMSSKLVLGLIDKQLAILDKRPLGEIKPIPITYSNYRINNNIIKKSSQLSTASLSAKLARSMGIYPNTIVSVLNNSTGFSIKNAREYWEDSQVKTNLSVTKQLSSASFLKDFSGDFRLVPVPKDWTALTELNPTNIQNDMKKHQQTALSKNDQKYVSNEVSYLLYKQSDYGLLKDGNYYYNPVSDPDDDFGSICKQLYDATDNGTKKIPLSFAIKNKQGEIETTVIASARIVKTPKVKKSVTGWFTDAYQVSYTEKVNKLHCKLLWLIKHYTWVSTTKYQTKYREVYATRNVDYDSYNMIIDPFDVSYILPSGDSINRMCGNVKAANKSFRDKTSNEIPNRWGLPYLNNFHNELTNIYPFSLDYFNKFGYSISNNIGRSSKQTVSSQVVKISGITIGNVLQNFIENDGRVKLRLSSKNYTPTLIQPYSALDNRIIGDKKSSKSTWVLTTKYTQTYHNLTTLSLRDSDPVILYANTSIPKASSTKEDNQWSKFILQSLTGFGILQYETGTPLRYEGSDIDFSKIKYCAFEVSDVFDTFIETCKLQISWLKEMGDFADRYLSDKMIYDTYLAVTDPNIINVVNKANSNMEANQDIYYTKSFTEDINYFSALAILDEAFKDKESGNTIYDTIQVRITELDKYISIAENLKEEFSKQTFGNWNTLEKFSIFLTDVYGSINGSEGCRALLLDKNTDYLNIDLPYLSQVGVDKSFNLIENPTTLIWAYLNVLYQARKFYINKRLDKVSGSYWILRSLERVLTFQAARASAIDKQTLIDEKVSKEATQNKNKAIAFVESRDTQNQLTTKDITDLTPSYTKAVYVPVDYILDPNFMKSNKYNKKENKYNGQEVTYVSQVYKSAYKPENGYYYIMSKDIKENITTLLDQYSETKKAIKTGNLEIKESLLDLINQVVTEEELYSLIKKITREENIYIDEDGEVIKERIGLLKNIYLNKTLKDAIKYNLIDGFVDNSSVEDNLQLLKNRLLTYYAKFYNDEISNNLFRVYIDWNTSEDGVGSSVSVSDIKYYIDEYQYQRTYGKRQTVIDPISGVVKVSTEGIKSGITFGVSDGINGEILNNLSSLDSLSAQELACSLTGKSDYWRIEVPESYNIPTSVLEKEPTLVSEYAFEMMLDYQKGKAITIESVLTGAQNYKASPIKPYDKTILTDATSISLTGVPSSNSLGAIGLSSRDTEPKFG